MMFCTACGAALPDNAKFCMNRGTPTAGASPPGPPAESASPSVYGSYGCSERQGNLVYVPGRGLFLIHESQALCFVPEEGGTPQAYRRKSGNRVQLDGLNVYNGKLYYWRYTEGGAESRTALMVMDLASSERKAVRLSEDVAPGLCGSERFPVVNGAMYLLRAPGNPQNRLCRIELDTGKVSHRDLPDLRTKAMPQDWKDLLDRLGQSLNPDQRSYGFSFTGFAALGEYGYVQRTSFPALVVRFRLDDPADFAYMPVNSCCVLRQSAGAMLSVCSNGLLGIGAAPGLPVPEGSLCITGLAGGGIAGSRCVLDLKKYDSFRKEWWKLSDSLYFIGTLKVDLAARKIKRMNFYVPARDFAPGPDGSAFVYDGEAVYRFPPQFWTQVSCEDDWKRFAIAAF